MEEISGKGVFCTAAYRIADSTALNISKLYSYAGNFRK
jgi:hypothetical protein